MAFDNLLLERDGAVATITINRPKVLNALNTATIDELRRAILELKADAAIRVAILTGAGERSFVAGADINELAVQTPTSGREHALAGQHVFDLVENLGKKPDEVTEKAARHFEQGVGQDEDREDLAHLHGVEPQVFAHVQGRETDADPIHIRDDRERHREEDHPMPDAARGGESVHCPAISPVALIRFRILPEHQ